MTLTRTPRIAASTWVVALIAGLSVTGCADAPDPLPVRAAVTWEGGTVPTVDGAVEAPRVEAVREYTRWLNASINALNFSDPGFAALARPDEIERAYKEVLYDVRHGELTLHSGPTQFSLIQVILNGEDESLVKVCLRDAVGWTLEDDAAEGATKALVGDDVWERRSDGFTIAEYWLDFVEGRWIVDRAPVEPESEYDNVGKPCEPEELASGTYVEQPDLGLLHDLTAEKLIDPEGEPSEQ